MPWSMRRRPATPRPCGFVSSGLCHSARAGLSYSICRRLKTAADIAGAVGELARAMAAGELTVEEASAASSVIEMQRRAIETSDIELRLRKLGEGAV
jgi:hypothetical protein